MGGLTGVMVGVVPFDRMITLIAIATGLFEFSYFYIRLQHEIWSFGNLPLPGLLLPGLATIGVVGAAAAMYWANRRIERQDVMGLRLRLAVAFLFGAAAVWMIFYNCPLTTR